MRIKFNWVAIVACLIILPVQISVANLNIMVEPNAKWGNVPTSNIKALCENVALHFNEQLRDEYKINGNLTIVYNSSGAIVFYPWTFGGGPNEYKIGLVVTGTFWAQFSYQFAHEFAHIMHNFEKTLDKENSWFRESICELANLWVIRRMGKTWSTRAPYANWIGWRHNLTNYADTLMNRAEVQYAGTGADWLSQWENKMRTDTGVFDYARVSQLSYKFLSIFENNPEAWNAIRQMPVSSAKMSDYMKIWHNEVDLLDKQFVKSMADVMGISVQNAVALSETDNNVDDAVYLALQKGSTPIPNEIGLNPTNPQKEWLYWGVVGENITNNSNPLVIDGKLFDRGISAVPSHEDYLGAILRYDLTGGIYRSFRGYLGLADEADVNIGTNANPSCNVGGSVVFYFEIDGNNVFTSDVITGEHSFTKVEFNIPEKAKELKIIIKNSGDTNWCDGAIIGDAQLLGTAITVENIASSVIDADIDNNGSIDLSDVLIVRRAIKNKTNYNTDVNNDGVTNETDVLLVKAKAHEAIAAAAPAITIRKRKLTTWGALKRRNIK